MVAVVLGDSLVEGKELSNLKPRRVYQDGNGTMVSAQPKSGPAQTGPRASESASSDGGCGLEVGVGCVRGGRADSVVVAVLKCTSPAEVEKDGPRQSTIAVGERVTDGQENDGPWVHPVRCRIPRASGWTRRKLVKALSTDIAFTAR
uniref:Uncharacterized protein n=1 Tax=Peronospora matthiolae TaxID=2874970 RepID=A0AAV1U9R9_9STRA